MLLLCLLVATGMCRCPPTEHGLRVGCISCCSRGSLTLRTMTTLPIGVAPAAGQLEASVSGLQPLVLLLEQNRLLVGMIIAASAGGAPCKGSCLLLA
jgi:hypothetical protein